MKFKSKLLTDVVSTKKLSGNNEFVKSKNSISREAS